MSLAQTVPAVSCDKNIRIILVLSQIFKLMSQPLETIYLLTIHLAYSSKTLEIDI